MMILTIKESPVLGGGAPLPSRPSRTGDFALGRSANGRLARLKSSGMRVQFPPGPPITHQSRGVAATAKCGRGETCIRTQDRPVLKTTGCLPVAGKRAACKLYSCTMPTTKPAMLMPKIAAKCHAPQISSRPPQGGRGLFTKTEQLADTVPGCSRGEAAPKGLGRPDYKPLMRKPRAACLCGRPDMVTAGDNFGRAAMVIAAAGQECARRPVYCSRVEGHPLAMREAGSSPVTSTISPAHCRKAAGLCLNRSVSSGLRHSIAPTRTTPQGME